MRRKHVLRPNRRHSVFRSGKILLWRSLWEHHESEGQRDRQPARGMSIGLPIPKGHSYLPKSLTIPQARHSAQCTLHLCRNSRSWFRLVQVTTSQKHVHGERKSKHGVSCDETMRFASSSPRFTDLLRQSRTNSFQRDRASYRSCYRRCQQHSSGQYSRAAFRRNSVKQDSLEWLKVR